MKLKSFLLLFAGLLICSDTFAVKTKVNRGPIHARTFNFVNRSSKPAPGFVDNTEAAHAMIQKAITNNLAARGVKRVASGGDLTVAYLIIVGDNVSTTAIRDYFGYSDDLGDLHEKAQKVYTRTKNPNHFDAGTLLIDIIDGTNFKLMKRGYATRPLMKNLSTGAKANRVQQVVDEILSDARIEQ